MLALQLLGIGVVFLCAKLVLDHLEHGFAGWFDYGENNED